MKRRNFLKDLIAGAVATSVLNTPLAQAAFSNQNSARQTSLRYLRPPGALAEDEFIKRCIRCGQCGEICPNTCISYFNTDNGIDSLNTPFIIPREKACILCMKCGDVCPTGAISAVKRTAEDIVEHVNMGQAQVKQKLMSLLSGKILWGMLARLSIAGCGTQSGMDGTTSRLRCLCGLWFM